MTNASPLPQAGDHIKADPRCIVSRGAGLAIRPPDTEDGGSLLRGIKRKLLKAQEHEQHRNPLQTLSNTMASNVTDCLLAPPFPGDIALVSVDSDDSRAPTPAGKPHHRHTQRRGATDTRGRQSRSAPAARGNGRRAAGAKGKEGQKFVLVTQALVAVGPGVLVTPLPASGGSPASLPNRGDGGSKVGALSICEGEGQIALAGYGRLRKMRLRAGQKRLVDSSRAVAWTSGITCLPVRGRGSGNTSGGPSAATATTFVGPGMVYVQTHSLAGLRRLLLPKAGVLFPGGVPGFGGAGRAGRGAGTSRRVEVGLSLKRGLAKRAKAGARRVMLALALFSLYVVVYSLVTTLLLEGRDGLVNAPGHAVQVVRSLAKMARRVVIVLIRLGQEELWRKEGDMQWDGEGNIRPHKGVGDGEGSASRHMNNPVQR